LPPAIILDLERDEKFRATKNYLESRIDATAAAMLRLMVARYFDKLTTTNF
jgi:hypothetical protein